MNIFPSKSIIPKDKILNVKFGIDPTSDLLHLGHLVPLLEVKRLMECGHKIDIVLGTFTAQLGDPSGRDSMRPILEEEKVKSNAKNILIQIKRVIGKNFNVHFNHTWFENMNSIELIRIFSKFNINQLLSRDSFQNRMKTNSSLGLHELLVPILQGIDSVKLKTNIEIGGSDQLFNFSITRDIQSNMNQEPEICILMDIINGIDGRKMSKSFNNCIFLNDTPVNVFGKTMSISDDLMNQWWKIFMIDEHREFPEKPIETKKRLAFKITKLIWDEEKANESLLNFEKIIQSKQLPDKIDVTNIKELIQVIININNCSKSEARRLISQKAIKINDEVVLENKLLNADDIVKVGKRKFVKVIV